MTRSVAPRVTKVPEIRSGDTVLLLAGKDAGKRGEVKRVERPALAGQPYRVVVEGLNIAKRHTKPRPRSTRPTAPRGCQQGGIIDKAMPVAIGRVMLVCPHCDRPTRTFAISRWRPAPASAPAPACGQPVEVKGA